MGFSRTKWHLIAGANQAIFSQILKRDERKFAEFIIFYAILSRVNQKI